MIIFKLDELVPCLKDMETGDIYDTEVIRIRRKSVLSHYNKRTGWYINWSKFPESTEVYALVLKGTNDIQGMIAVEYNDEFQAVHVVWDALHHRIMYGNMERRSSQALVGIYLRLHRNCR